jgi:hypothetical protein
MSKMNKKEGHVQHYIVYALILAGIIIISLMVIILSGFYTQVYELALGLIIVLGVCVLTVLLFLMAAAFNALGLSDDREALSLPQGSISAMIALLLILVWAIISIYVFRFVAFGSGGTNGGASADGVKLAQQLFTTMSTLVVAISAFYFGTSSAAVTRRRQETPTKSQPIIWKIDPNQGRQDTTDLSLSILGRNFRSPNTVQLVRDNDTIDATEVFSSDTEIRCKIEIALNHKPGPWNLIVANGDGSQDQLDKAFQIIAE